MDLLVTDRRHPPGLDRRSQRDRGGRQGDQESALTLVFGLLGLVVFSVLYMRMVKAAVAGTTANREIVASGVLTVVLLLTQETHLWGWGLLAPSWAVGAALLLNRTGTLVVSVGAVAAGLLLASFDAVPVLGRAMVAPYTADDSALTGAFIGFALVLPGTNRFQLWFWKIVKSAEEGKEAQARLAVTEERLRFSRDLHDLVGHSLSAIAVKSEVAVKLSKVDTGRAVAEMDEVRGLARQALKEIRTAVRGYRTVDLDAELRSMTAVLEAAGIRCTLDTPEERLPEESATLLAWVVREGTTNVLRHSSATRCRIVVALRDGTAVLEMTNDGMTEAGGRGGTGLVGLSERLAATGAESPRHAGGAGEFRLRATVPLEGM
ncbi:sensor histidine kinase [Streptosporangium lutulentum]